MSSIIPETMQAVQLDKDGGHGNEMTFPVVPGVEGSGTVVAAADLSMKWVEPCCSAAKMCKLPL